MIYFIEGKLVEALPMRAVIDARGVGYEILIPLSTFEKLPLASENVRLLTHLHVREDEHLLFGFATAEERDLFKLLIHHVSGIGPKLALNILSGCSPSQLREAVIQSDTVFLSRLKGVGKKTAERVIVELRDKVGVTQAWAATANTTNLTAEQQTQNDALLALITLGYKQADALKALQASGNNGTVSDRVREALKHI